MFKRIGLLVVMLISLLYMGMGSADAADYYLGEYPDGREAYLVSIIDFEVTRNGYWAYDEYDCRVKAVYKNSDSYEEISYRVVFGLMGPFIEKNGRYIYDRNTRENFLHNNPVENNLLKQIYALRKRQGKAN